MIERGEGISFNGLTYKLVTSPDTGRVWLDRNLGATQVATVLVHKRAPRPTRPADMLPSAVPFWPATGIFKKLEKALVAPSIGVVVAKVATSFDDSAAYGDLYQWGRAKDGHEDRTRNSTSATLTSGIDTGANDLFIMTSH
jgi:hypothetical protein